MSKILMQFLKENFGVQKNKPIFSSKSKAFFKTIYKEIIKSERQWILKGNESISRSYLGHVNGNKFKEDIEYTHIPEEIRHIIDHEISWIGKYTFSLNGDTYTISMVHPNRVQDTEIKIRQFFEDVLHKIYLWLHVIHLFAPEYCSQQMHIQIFFTEHIKIIAKTELEPLDKIHSNSAFTTGCARSTNIHIYRKEEWFKVFIHETFHNLGLDFSNMDNRMANRMICQLFPIPTTDIRLYETYCEIWAELLHLLFFVFFTIQDKKIGSFDRIIQKMERLLHYEIIFSIFQCAKILNHYHISYQQLTDPTSKLLLESRYKENTQILSYYILKTVLIYESDYFVQWCLQHNGFTVEFKKTKDNVQEFCQLIKQMYKNPSFLDKLQTMERWFKKYQHSNQIEFDTMRMTLFEL